jgi:hypothetical protein
MESNDFEGKIKDDEAGKLYSKILVLKTLKYVCAYVCGIFGSTSNKSKLNMPQT